MNTLKTLLISAISLLPFLSSCNNGVEENNTQQKLDEEIVNLHRSLENSLGHDVPSLSVLIDGPRGTYFTSSAGKNGKKITADTYFRFASNTKNFTSAAILNMMEDGWLDIDDLIIDNMPTSNIPYVPAGSQWAFPNKNQITIKQLLQHNAGVFDVSNDTVPGFNGKTYVEYMLGNYPNYQFSATDLVHQLTLKKLTYGQPNSVYHYSNTGYTILGEIISRVYSLRSAQSKTYGDYLKDKMYDSSSPVPLNLHFVESATDQQLPTPYVTGMIRYPDNVTITDLINASPHVAEGNGVGTISQLNRYIRTLMKGENILTKNTITRMQTESGVANTPQTHYALGCSNHPILGYGHNGATEGYLSTMMYDPKTDVSVIVVIPYWDLTDGMNSLGKCLKALVKAGLVAREAVGYPGA
ncbi:MAG: serine hydrolase domain-containing protein [Kaistella sp.]